MWNRYKVTNCTISFQLLSGCVFGWVIISLQERIMFWLICINLFLSWIFCYHANFCINYILGYAYLNSACFYFIHAICNLLAFINFAGILYSRNPLSQTQLPQTPCYLELSSGAPCEKILAKYLKRHFLLSL